MKKKERRERDRERSAATGKVETTHRDEAVQVSKMVRKMARDISFAINKVAISKKKKYKNSNRNIRETF